MNWTIRSLGRFGDDQNGNVTVEFVIVFPVLMFMFMLAFEIGLWNIRELSLRHSINAITRDMRVATADPLTYEEMRAAICDGSIFKSGCEDSLLVEMVSQPISEWARPDQPTPCIDRREEGEPVREFKAGLQNNLMLVRVCRLYRPLFPGGSLGRSLATENGVEYGVRVITGFVSEPLS